MQVNLLLLTLMLLRKVEFLVFVQILVFTVSFVSPPPPDTANQIAPNVVKQDTHTHTHMICTV